MAVGAVCGAGIGGGGNDSSCGTITIAGGITTATGGGSGAAGIGAGACDPELDTSTCGDIVIGADIVRVVAKRGSGGNGNECIGAGEGSDPVRVTVDPGLADDHGSQTRTIAYAWDGNLATLTRNVTIASDMTIYGELAGQYKISIADGVKVTLDNAAITNGVDSSDYPWAGLNCLGDAQIVLAPDSENFVKGFERYCPGVYVPSGSTLTISGSGSLEAGSNGLGAGIGGGYQLDCGNIVINGGRIAATGGTGAAGIGSGRSHACGNITITGGSVTATGGGYAAGIGTGDLSSSCGDITITGGSVTATGGTNGTGIGSADDTSSCGAITIGANIVQIVATCGSGSANPIGKGGGDEASCGTVTVDSSLTDDNGSPTRTITGGGSGSGYAAWAAANGVSGAWDAVDASGVANVFRYAFDKPTGLFTEPVLIGGGQGCRQDAAAREHDGLHLYDRGLGQPGRHGERRIVFTQCLRRDGDRRDGQDQALLPSPRRGAVARGSCEAATARRDACPGPKDKGLRPWECCHYPLLPISNIQCPIGNWQHWQLATLPHWQHFHFANFAKIRIFTGCAGFAKMRLTKRQKRMKLP